MTDYSITIELAPGLYECSVGLQELNAAMERLRQEMFELTYLPAYILNGVRPGTVTQVDRLFAELPISNDDGGDQLLLVDYIPLRWERLYAD